MSVGTLFFEMCLRKSPIQQSTHAMVPIEEARAATVQLSSSTLTHKLPARDVVVVEVAQELHQERGTVRANRGLDSLEHLGVHTFWIVTRFDQIRSQGPDEHRFT